MKELVLQNITKKMGGDPLLTDVTIAVEKGEIRCLLGPSGCGKTTLLRIAAGLEAPDTGDVLFCGRSMLATPPHRRNFGMMFQEFALFPHRNVFENIAFGLEMKKESKQMIASRVSEMLELVSLEGYRKRRVDELSGGERQRVALARTLAPNPGILMLDEPLGALDRLLRERLLADLCHILNTTGITTIFVTHDQNEAFAAADLVSVMDRGAIEQTDSPERLYQRPASRKITDFLGFQNIIQARRVDKERVTTRYGDFLLPDAMEDTGRTGGRVSGDTDLLLHPACAAPLSRKQYNTRKINRIAGVVLNTFFQGSIKKVVLETVHNECLSFDLPGTTPLPEKGEELFLAVTGPVLLPCP
ncbi:MAG: ABC transporter ATP-binding protein [Desulfobacteraceae bacterium]